MANDPSFSAQGIPEEADALARQKRLREAIAGRPQGEPLALSGDALDDAWRTLSALAEALARMDQVMRDWRNERNEKGRSKRPNLSELARREEVVSPFLETEKSLLADLFAAGWRLPESPWPQGAAWRRDFLRKVFFRRNGSAGDAALNDGFARANGAWMRAELERDPALWPEVLGEPAWAQETLRSAPKFDPQNAASSRSAARALRAACSLWKSPDQGEAGDALLKLGAARCLSPRGQAACLSAWLPRRFKGQADGDVAAGSLRRWVDAGVIDPAQGPAALRWLAQRRERARRAS